VLKQPGQDALPLSGLCAALLFPDGRGGDAEYRGQGQAVSRAAITMMGNDQLVYRLIRNLGGSGALQKLNPADQQFELLSEDPTEIGQFLRSQVGLPAKKAFEALFSFTSRQLPTKRPRPSAAVASTPPSTTLLMGAAPLVEAARDIGAAEAKIAALQAELALSSEVERIQARADEVASTLFGIEERLKGSQTLKEELRRAEGAHSRAPTVESLKLPPDIAARAERFPALAEKYEQAMAKLASERENEVEAAPQLIQPLIRRPAFWASVALGVTFFAVGMLFSGGARYLAFLDIPSFGIAAFLAIRYVDDLKDSQRARGKGERISSREKKIQEAFEAQARVIKAAVSALQVESPAQILEVLGRKAQLEVKATELRDQLAARERTPEYLTALSEEGKLKQEQKELNDQLTEKGAYTRDAREVEREIERLRQSIARARAKPEPVAPAVNAPPLPTEDPFPALLSLGADLFGVDVVGAGAMIRDRWIQYFTALTNQRYQGIELDKDSKAHVLSGGQKTAAVAIPGKDLDLLYLAARLTLIEKHSARNRVPCLFDDLFTDLDDAKLFLLGRMLKQLSAMTQVLHVAGQPGFSQLADGTVAM
jgi:hypothetical protein